MSRCEADVSVTAFLTAEVCIDIAELHWRFDLDIHERHNQWKLRTSH